ncbi:hypothetical protein [Pontibacter amylolyticus]|uniref:hypothetical protein n=1 Tax=Pontibacter amylolyticus TaxID=1424080 RepID=UPI0016684248|nr:hypothetical protein [Pontibacter amylolyticus]
MEEHKMQEFCFTFLTRNKPLAGITSAGSLLVYSALNPGGSRQNELLLINVSGRAKKNSPVKNAANRFTKWV